MRAMLKAIHCDTQDHVFRHLTSLEQARDVKNLPKALLWLDLQSPSEQELVKLGQEFALHPLAIEDASREHQRPKVEEYEHFYFVVFYSVSLDAHTAGLDICELDMFLGKNYLITVHN
jgi:magnesium transporter